MTKSGRKARRRRRRARPGYNMRAPAGSPMRTFKRTFRRFYNIKLDNTAGTGTNQYAYKSLVLKPDLDDCQGFKEARSTFELWRLCRIRVMIQPGYSSYNQSYNTINQDAIAATQVWTAPDFGLNESVSGVSLLSYQNARCHTLSLNAMKTVVNTQARFNVGNIGGGSGSRIVLPYSTWLDSAGVQNPAYSYYSGYQMFVKMNGLTGTDYLPIYQIVEEYDVEFKQPGFQNLSSNFQDEIVGTTFAVIPDGSAPDELRTYVCVSFTINDQGNNYRFERQDGEPGSLDYTSAEMTEVYEKQTSGKYFGDRKINYWNGPVPLKI